MTASWFETRLPTILSNYELPDIYNADEFGLFFQALPSKSLHLKDEKCIGVKFSKFRLTGLAVANANGEKLFIIGKSKSPRCFKNLKQLPCRYRGQKKSWMDSDLFEEWVRELDRKFEQQNRKVVLIIDNCPAHPAIGGLKAIQLCFLPPNTTAVTQPMDQVVIRSLKAKYRSRLIKLIIKAIDSNKDIPKINVLDAMKLFMMSWEDVTENTVQNCFAKARISNDDQLRAQNDLDDPFIELRSSIEELKERNSEEFLDDISPEVFTNLDDSVVAAEPVLTDELIIEMVRKGEDEDVESDDDDESANADVSIEKPGTVEVRNAVETLMNFSLFSISDKIRTSTIEISRLIEIELVRNLKQASIKDFFKSKNGLVLEMLLLLLRFLLQFETHTELLFMTYENLIRA